MFERRTEPLLPRRQFVARVLRGIALGLSLLAVALGGGMVGYRLTGMSWVDAYLNASMILAGMGQVDELHTPGAKVFAGTYALFSGVVFLSTVAVLLAPIAHRMLHRFHIETGHEHKAKQVSGEW